VPDLALRFRPPDAMRAKVERGPERAADSGRGARDENRAVLWKLDERGEPVPIRVKAGITDGQDTAVEGPDLQEGMRVIAAMTSAASSSDSKNPFQQASQRGPGPPGGIRP
jgi:hypothetical protein